MTSQLLGRGLVTFRYRAAEPGAGAKTRLTRTKRPAYSHRMINLRFASPNGYGLNEEPNGYGLNEEPDGFSLNEMNPSNRR